MIIDFHTHVFPDQKSAMILSSLSKRAGIPHFTDGTLSGLMDSMKKSGIHLSVISRITTRSDKVVAINQWLYDLRGKNILPLATIHPDLQQREEYIEELKRTGFKGIKVHPDYQGFYADDMRMYPFYDALQSSGMPILFHAGLDRAFQPPFHAMPEQLLKVHREFPQLKMVAAHMGGEDNYQETEECLLGTDIYLDTAFVFRIMDKNILKRFFRKHPVDRFLFGSDSPFSEQSEDLKYLMNLSYLNQEEKEMIAGKNAADLLGL